MNRTANRTTVQAVIGALKAAKIDYAQYSTRPRRLVRAGVEADQIGRLIVIQYHDTETDRALIDRNRSTALKVAAAVLTDAGFAVQTMLHKGMVVVGGKFVG